MRLLINIFCLGLLTLATASCCVLKMDNVTAEATAAAGGACVLTEDGGDPIMGIQVGNYFVLEPGACTGELSFGTGLLYSRRGFRDSNEYEEGGDGMEPMSYSSETTLITHYLDIPVIASMPITGGLSAYAGPQASILLGAKRTYEVNGQEAGSEKGTDGLNGLDLGFTVGVKYELNNGLQLGLGLDQGLRDVYKSEYGSSKSKNQVIKATVGLNINKFKNR